MSWVETILGATRGQILARLRRRDQSISELAAALGISANAVRGHIGGLQRDGLVEPAAVARGAIGKPAQLYRITLRGDGLFAHAYVFVLSELLRVLQMRDGSSAVVDALRAVGARAAEAQRRNGDDDARVASAAEVLRSLGGDVEVERANGGWLLRGHACPLSALVREHPHVCALAHSLIAELTELPVTECCDRGDRPRCAFRISPGAPRPT